MGIHMREAAAYGDGTEQELQTNRHWLLSRRRPHEGLDMV
jgi:hypothetical protein